MMHMEGYHDARAGNIMSTVGMFSTVGGDLRYRHSNGPLGHRMDHWHYVKLRMGPI